MAPTLQPAVVTGQQQMALGSTPCMHAKCMQCRESGNHSTHAALWALACSPCHTAPRRSAATAQHSTDYEIMRHCGSVETHLGLESWEAGLVTKKC